MRAPDAARTFSTNSGRKRSISNETAPPGLAIKSTAPSSIASSVASAPSAVSEEIITTGRGASINQAIEAFNPFFRHLTPVMQTLSAPDTKLQNFFKNIGQASAEVAPVAADAAQPTGAPPDPARRPRAP